MSFQSEVNHFVILCYSTLVYGISLILKKVSGFQENGQLLGGHHLFPCPLCNSWIAFSWPVMLLPNEFFGDGILWGAQDQHRHSNLVWRCFLVRDLSHHWLWPSYIDMASTSWLTISVVHLSHLKLVDPSLRKC